MMETKTELLRPIHYVYESAQMFSGKRPYNLTVWLGVAHPTSRPLCVTWVPCYYSNNSRDLQVRLH